VFYLFGKQSENRTMSYMTVKEARYHNAKLLQESLPGGQRAFCEKLNKAQSQVSSFLGDNPSKGIGDKIACQIEQAFGKPKGWLDTPHNNANTIASGAGTLISLEQTVQEAPAEYQTGINNKQLLLALLKASQISEDAELLAKEAYDYVDIATLATSLYGEYEMDEHSLDNEIEKLKQKHRKHTAKTG
jgi:hypothetical protein